MNISNEFELLDHLPRRYDSFLLSPSEDKLLPIDKTRLTMFGTITSPITNQQFKGISKCSFNFQDHETAEFVIEAWNRPFLTKSFSTGDEVTLQGIYDAKKRKLNLITMKKGKIPPDEAIVPVYALPKDFQEYQFRRLMKKAYEIVSPSIEEDLPKMILDKYRLASKKEAYGLVHFPKDYEDVRLGWRRFKYGEALNFSLRNKLIRASNKGMTKDKRRKINREKLKNWAASLPYKLTKSQRDALNAAIVDMDSPSLMYRLLQGDVGTGKTLVAAILMYANHLRSEQTALMAPTDSLARQHYQTLRELFKDTRIVITLLVGNQTAEERRNALNDIEDGTTDIVVGTHALISTNVNFAYLGLAIIDEQHKFGVNQRGLLANKGDQADILLMSATPIPRTLCLTIYGDLDVSTLTEFPSGKRDITTKLIDFSKEKEVFLEISRSLQRGNNIYVVAPKIEFDESNPNSSVLSIYEKIKKVFGDKVALMHGKLQEDEKIEALNYFKSKRKPILVSTSIIEVGIDVQDADLMVIYEANHFSLSSLHQLRGRIGRNGKPSTCLLVSNVKDDEDAKEKLDVLVKSEDGFFIAEEDLRLRGPGTIAGTKQSGMPDMHYANIITDFKMFECARDDASYILCHPEIDGFSEYIAKVKEEIGDQVISLS